MKSVLEIRDLTVNYSLPQGGSILALDQVSLTVGRGESIAITGPSGSGKSTLALAILRMLPSNAAVNGAICFGGRDLMRLEEREVRCVRGAHIAMVFQQPAMALHPFMRAGQQVAEVVRAHRGWDWRRCREQARAVLERMFHSGVDRIFGRYPHELSGGECQRVSIAQAVACEPDILIADEPTAMLDTVAQAGVLQIFHEFRRNPDFSLVFITHRLELISGLVERMVMLGRQDHEP
jgi:ABC-type glutathione transport system ATPase component